jgi:hypothetical protein
MQTFLAAESDATCKRNAFVFLASAAMEKAVEWIMGVYDTIGGLDEGLQMSIIEVIRADCKNDPSNRVRGGLSLALEPSDDLFRRGILDASSNSSMPLPMPSNTKQQQH